MEAQKSDEVTDCRHKCDDCSLGSHAMPTGGGDLAGIKLVAAGAIVFLFPLILAIAGAIFVAGSKTRQLAGAVMGLIAGVVLAVVVVRLAMKSHKNSKKSDIGEIKEHR